MTYALTDQLADTWRWWACLGALLGFILLFPWAMRQCRSPEPIRINKAAKVTLAFVMLGAMAGWFIAGAIIPAANDGRLDWFTTEHFLYRGGIAAAWLLWGCCSWGVAIVMAKRLWHKMLAGSVAWWLAMFFAAAETMNRAAG